MILDNKNENQKVYEWLKEYTESGKSHKTPFKNYLIESIEQIFIKYTPRQLYYKVLFELFGNQLLSEQDNPEFNRQVGKYNYI